MRLRIIGIFFIILIFFSAILPVFAENVDNGDTIVYVTETGDKYHRSTCGYLRSKYEITLREAVERGYAPCSRCNPPRFNGVIEKQKEKESSSSQNQNQQRSRSEKDTTVISDKAAIRGNSNQSKVSTFLSKVETWFGVIVIGGFIITSGYSIIRLAISNHKEKRRKRQ